MLRHEGAERTDKHNQRLAACLAQAAGFVNSAGFVVLGTFTSHVTGNVGRFAQTFAEGSAMATLAALMIIAFFLGAFVANVAMETNIVRARPLTYGGILLVEAALLGVFLVSTFAQSASTPVMRDVQAMLLCGAMGLQNGLVTRLSGAVVRTTHLTGVVTDLGIEGARWFRYWRSRIGERAHLRLVAGAAEMTAPNRPKTIILLTIIISFVIGSLVGAVLAMNYGQIVFVVPIAGLSSLGLYAAFMGRTLSSQRG